MHGLAAVTWSLEVSAVFGGESIPKTMFVISRFSSATPGEIAVKRLCAVDI
jgi:hypothetical protein